MRTRAISRGGWLLLVTASVLTVGTTAATAPGGTKASEATGDFGRGSVTYFRRACAADGSPIRYPVSAGELVLRRGGAQKTIDLGGGGKWSANLPGSGDVKAELVLQNARVRVVGTSPSTTPGEVAGASATVVPLFPAFDPSQGPIVLSPGRHADLPTGAVNIMEVLDRGAQVANKARPAQLPRVTAQWFSGKVAARPGTHYEEDNLIVVGLASGAPGSGPVAAEWEPVPLLHEYGHDLLAHHADPDSPGGEHSLNDAYPDKTALAWSEGFASAFAAVVLRDGSLTVDCGKQYQNLDTSPARPTLKAAHRRFAQYNETRTAALTWRVMTKLGSSDPAVGLAKLLGVLKVYRRAGKPVQSTRDLRDAIAMTLEKTKADQVVYDEIFLKQGISWSRGLEVHLPAALLVPALPAGIPAGPITGLGLSQAVVEMQVRVEGPGGLNCRLKTDTGIQDQGGKLDNGVLPLPFLRKAAEGGLAFSNNDDCWLGGGDGMPNTTLGGVPVPDGNLASGPVGGGVALPFPYLSSLAHWKGDYRVIAKYMCAVQPHTAPAPIPPPKCPAQVEAPVTAYAQVEDPAIRKQTSTVTLRVNQDTTLLTFEAQGGNCSLASNSKPIDCSI